MQEHEHLNLNVRGLGLSATVAINERSARLMQEGRTLARLGLGQSPFPIPVSVVEALRANATCKEYLAVRGLYELREAVADYHRRRANIACSADDVMVGPGSKELMFLLQVAFYGELVVPTPAWVSYVPQAQIAGRRIALLHTSQERDYHLTAAELESLCSADPRRPRVVVLNYPCNPTGTTYSVEELAALAEVARRFKIVVLSDEIYGELHFAGTHVSIATLYPEGTIVSSGLSKWCGAGGWRLGTFVFPPQLHWLMNAMAAIASETFTSTSAPLQHAAVTAFRGGMAIERYLWRVRRILAALTAACAGYLRAARLHVPEPAGAFYLFPDFGPIREALARHGISTSAELAERLLSDVGVAVLPGSDFCREPNELTLRFSLVDFDGAKALAAIETLPADHPIEIPFLETHCCVVIEGVRRVAAWAKELNDK
jgi:aspartate aminotransferase